MKKAYLFAALFLSLPLFSKNFDYGEALKKVFLFYEAQRSGERNESKYIYKLSWPRPSCLKDGKDNGVDLTGGWYDAGDYVKFSLPMAYSASMMGWGILVGKKALKKLEIEDYAKSNLKYALDYFLKSYKIGSSLKKDIFFYQVGDPKIDHKYWMPAEDINYERKSYYCSYDSPCSGASSQTAAALAIGYLVFKNKRPLYARKLLKTAKRLYLFSKTFKGNSGYKMAKGSYDDPDYKDELSFAAIWLYIATEDKKYLKDALNFGYELNKDSIYWPLNWGDKDNAVFLLLAVLTDNSYFHNLTRKHLHYWMKKAKRTKGGLVFADKWGSLQYAANLAFISLVYSDFTPYEKDKTRYINFAKSQIDYILGDNPRKSSYLIGFGSRYPKNPHHANSHHSPTHDINYPVVNTYELTGAMVGGPKSLNDFDYKDDRKDYIGNEVSISYNASLIGALAKLYTIYNQKNEKEK